ncbi:hypothetical protein [Azospirillum largimobile]
MLTGGRCRTAAPATAKAIAGKPEQWASAGRAPGRRTRG